METAETHLHTAAQALQHGHAHEALDEARAVLRTQPENGQAHAVMGLAWSMMGDEPEARDEIARSVSLAPRDAHVRYYCYLALGQLGDIPGARAQLTYFSQLEPNNVQAKAALAKLGGPILDLPPLPRAAHHAVWYDGGGHATTDSEDLDPDNPEPPEGPDVLHCSECTKRTWKGWVCMHCGARLM